MKKLKVATLLLVTVLIVGFAGTSLAAPPGEWPTKKGAICLTVWVWVPDPGICATCGHYEDVGTVNMYVVNMGDDNYLVTGRNAEADGISPFIGTAEIIETIDGPKVKIHVTSSGTTDDDVHGNMATVILDPATLKGEFESLDLSASKSDLNDYNVSSAGTRYLSPCGTEYE